jgi:hypothetical protein
VPVPVLLTLRGWDPVTQCFTQWLADRLSGDYRLLKAREFGSRAAARLVSSGLISVILDGLDEIAEDLRPVALRALDEQVTFRLVLLCRSHEMAVATTQGHLSGAAALELQPVGPGEGADYLTRCQVHPLPVSWARVISSLREHPGGAVARALSSPLMLTLVRDAYQPGDPVDELLDTDRFKDHDAVEDHLLDRVLSAAYTPRPGQAKPHYTLKQAQQWLGFIACKMNQDTTRDLTWWLMPQWKPTWSRIVVTSLMFGLVVSLMFDLVVGLVYRPVDRLGIWLTIGCVYGCVSGLVIGLISELRKPMPRQTGRLRWSKVFAVNTLMVELALGLVYGLAGGFAFGLAYGPLLLKFFEFMDGLLVGLVGGVVIGLVGGLMVGIAKGLSQPAAKATNPIDPITFWRRDRRFWLVGGLMVGIVVGLAHGLMGIMFKIVSGLALGLAGGLAGGVVVGIVGGIVGSATWSTALVFAQLRFAGECPFRVLNFLEDARERRVLRVIGPMYQFRHRRLQERLAQSFEKELNTPTGRVVMDLESADGYNMAGATAK